MGEKMQFTELDQYLFGQGTHYDIYKKLGAHPTTQHRKKGVYFAVWAPNARYVSVIGDFNNWDNQANPMNRVGAIPFSSLGKGIISSAINFPARSIYLSLPVKFVYDMFLDFINRDTE